MMKLDVGLTPALPISESNSTVAWVCRRRLKGQPLQARHKQDCGREFIFLLTQSFLLSGSEAGSAGAKPALSFVIKHRQSSCFV